MQPYSCLRWAHPGVIRRTCFSIMLVLFVALSAWPAPASPLHGAQSVIAAPSPQDAPTALISSGVTDFALAAPKIFWHTAAICSSLPPHIAPTAASDPEVISRIATYGGLVRQLFYRNDDRPAGVCNPYHIHSNIIADDNSVYWIDDSGLVRLPTSAKVGDPPILLSSVPVGAGIDLTRKIELAQNTGYVFAMTYDAVGNATIRSIRKSNGVAAVLSIVNGSAHSLSSDGEYAYWIASNNLERFNLTTFVLDAIASGVTGYYAEGRRVFCTFICYFEKNIFIGKGYQIVRYNNVNNSTSAPIYTSDDSAAIIYSLTSDSTHLFLFESRPQPPPCPGCFPYYSQVLVSIGRNGGTPTPLYIHQPNSPVTIDIANFTTDGSFLFWQERDALQRLPNDASALPLTNMRVTGIEVTQGVQRLDNSVPLIQNRRTFVRVYVKSDGVGDAVPGVSAYLHGSWAGGTQIGGPLLPVNQVGTAIAVQSSPHRNALDESFLFELPWDWTTKNDLTLRAELNPGKVPLESSYSDNSMTAGPFAFTLSTRLETWFVRFAYDLNGIHYAASENTLASTIDWTRRLYPLASTPGTYQDPSPGFRPTSWETTVPDLAERVQNNWPLAFGGNLCSILKDPNLCTTIFVNGYLASFRLESLIFGSTPVPDHVTLYGVIPQPSTNCRTNIIGPFVTKTPCVRGSTPGNDSLKVASGEDTLILGKDASGDGRGTFTHETGHVLGRQHPWKGSAEDTDKCGNTRDDGAFDYNYPYTDGQIGPDNPTAGELDSEGNSILEGFDPGTREIKPGRQWYDIMSYCRGSQWISN